MHDDYNNDVICNSGAVIAAMQCFTGMSFTTIIIIYFFNGEMSSCRMQMNIKILRSYNTIIIIMMSSDIFPLSR